MCACTVRMCAVYIASFANCVYYLPWPFVYHFYATKYCLGGSPSCDKSILVDSVCHRSQEQPLYIESCYFFIFLSFRFFSIFLFFPFLFFFVFSFSFFLSLIFSFLSFPSKYLVDSVCHPRVAL